MPTTLSLNCALRGLRFTSGPLPGLHICKDQERGQALATLEDDDDGRA